MKNIVILISGRGSNMAAIARACQDERWPARIAAVIADRAAAPGLAVAAALGIEVQVVDNKMYTDAKAFDAALAEVIDRFSADLVLLAGFMRKLTTHFIHRYGQYLLNIHPSLLPSFPGLHTHQAALAAGVKVHGATVHFVTAKLDRGPIVAQAVVPVNAEDNPVTLAARVLAAEHQLYSRAVRWFIEGRLRCHGEQVTLTPSESQWLIAA
jgi:phosphoribosylglycinamide formyltransferase 1